MQKYLSICKNSKLEQDAYAINTYIQVINLLKIQKNQTDFHFVYNEMFVLFKGVVEFYIESLNVAYAFNDWNFAIDIAKNFRKFFPENVLGYIKGCHAFSALKRYEDAEQLGIEMFQKWPNNRDVLVRYTQNAMDNADWLLAYERSVYLREIIPNEWYGWQIGCAALKEARYIEESLSLTSKMLQKFPNNKICLWEACKVYDVSRQYENLLLVSSKLTSVWKDNVNGYLYKCKSLSSLGYRDEADIVAENSISLFNNNIQCWNRYILNAIDVCDWSVVYERTKQALMIHPLDQGIYLKQYESLCKLYTIDVKNLKTDYAELLLTCKQKLLSLVENTPQFVNIFDSINVISAQNNITENILRDIEKHALEIDENCKNEFLESEVGGNSTISLCSYINGINNFIVDNGGKLYVYIYPLLKNILRKNSFDIKISSRQYGKFATKKRYESDYFSELYEKNDSLEFIKAVCTPPKIYKNTENFDVFEDFSSKWVNTVNGNRVSVSSIYESPKNNIYIYGSCIAYGIFSEDECTIESYLQKLINSNGYNYKVHNRGLPGIHIDSIYKSIMSTKIDKGDIVIIIPPYLPKNFNIFRSFCLAKKIPFFELSYYFSEHYNFYSHLIADLSTHLTRLGNKLVAQKFFDDIILGNTEFLNVVDEYTKKYITKCDDNLHSDVLPKNDEYYEQIQKMFENVPKFEGICVGGKNGAIVMNCNPITNGHMHLITLASKIVNHLYIFVVEEDKSFFKFADRFELVKAACKDLKNVIVVPSGKFILSAETFPDYFVKSENNDITVDTSNDIHIFGKYICKLFDISIRFTGEEPIDKVTKQYNETMSKILPKYGVTFLEIPRKAISESEDQVISASYVRKLLKEKNFEEIKKVVPITTYDFLIKNYS